MATSTTRQERVLSELRADILGGRLLPGERLPFAAICERYNASVGVVRESLSRLVEQGLVRAEAQQGFHVTPVSRADLRQLTDARVAIETMTLRRAIAEGDVTWESKILAVHHRLDRTPMIDPGHPARLRDEWSQVHAQFHDILLQGCANTRLVAIAATLRDAAELYRRWSVALVSEGLRDIPKEHRDLMEAVLARDEELAVSILTDHIELTTTLLLSSQAGEHAESQGLPPIPAS